MFKLTKTIVAISFACFFQQTALADPIVELDNKNYVHCMKQLEKTKDEVPVILVYASHCIFAKIFMPTYKEVANSPAQQNRAFFQFDWDNSDRETIKKCLGISENTMLVSPIIIVPLQLRDQETGKWVRSMPIRAWGGVKPDPESGDAMSISPEELTHIITFGEEIKLYKAQYTKEHLNAEHH